MKPSFGRLRELHLRVVALAWAGRRWRFRKYDVAPRLGVRAVEHRVRQALRRNDVSCANQH